MPRKTVTSKTETVVSTPAPAPVKGKKGKNAPKTKKEERVEEVEELEEETSDVETTVKSNDKKDVAHEVDSDEVVETKTRRQPTRESVVESFDELVASIESEIARLRETPQTKTKGVKFLRSLGKRVKSLRGQTTRVMKQRVRTNRKNNNNSGFLKPVQISKEMAKFTGWDPELLRSRVDVTKYVCNYIRENNLQNPTDRRQILADSKLSKLLSYDAKKATEPLTYYRIQTHLKPHFIKSEVPPASA